MSTEADVLKILQMHVRRNQNPRTSFTALLAFTYKYLEKFGDDNSGLEDLDDNTENILAARLIALEEAGRCSLQYADGKVVAIHYPEYYALLILREYKKIEDRPDHPFPTEDTIGVEIPSDSITPVDVKSDFIDLLSTVSDKKTRVFRLLFPDEIKSLLVTGELVPRRIIEFCVQKIRVYLRSEKNASYVRSKLQPVFRQKEATLQGFLNTTLTTPGDAVSAILSPTELSFLFWTQLSSVIIKELGQKKDKLLEEHSYCQAAYLLGYYNVFFKSSAQKERDTEMTLKTLENTLRKPPYAYTVSQILAFTDNKGVPLSKKVPNDEITRYLQKRIASPDKESLPDIVNVRAPGNREYFVAREALLPLLLNKIQEASDELSHSYAQAWYAALRQDQKYKMMDDDQAFEAHVERTTAEQFPLLRGLLRYDLVYLAAKEANLSRDALENVNRLFDAKKNTLAPLTSVLRLDRARIYSDARLMLPFWQAVPIISTLVKVFKRLFLGIRREKLVDESDDDPGTSEQGERGKAVTSKARINAFKDAVRDVQKQYVGDNRTVDETLAELIERWNNLLDPTAKANLVEDVNSLARDFLRKMRVGTRLVPPDKERIEYLGRKLSEAEAFERLRDKESLQRYLELYMLKVLGK